MRTVEGREYTRCGSFKPWNEFPKMSQSSTGHRPDCKPCHVKSSIEHRNERRLADPVAWDQRRSEIQLKSHHGLTMDQYEEMLKLQNYVCAICGSPDSRIKRKSPRPLVVDHDHKTGEIRGLLCDPCNVGLARFDDDSERMIVAAAYLSQGGVLSEL